MQKFSRRHFLKQTSALAAGAAAERTLQGAVGSKKPGEDLRRSETGAPAGPHLSFPTEPRQRLAVASWPFRAFIESPTNRNRKPAQPGMDLKDFAARVAKRFGLHNVEPLGEHFRSTNPAYLEEFRNAVEEAGSHVVDIPVSVGTSFYDPEPAKRRRAIENGKKWVDIAVALGSPSIRAHIQGIARVSPDLNRAAASLTQLAAYGAAKNIIVNLENDDLVSEEPFFLVKVIEKVGSSYLRALPDFCNSMLSGDADFNYRGVSAMFQHAYNIAHVKDSEVGDNGKLYTVDVGRTFGIAKASGYRGYFSMEWEGQGEPYAGIQKLIDDSLKYLS